MLPQYLFAFASSPKLGRSATSRTGGWGLGIFFIIKHVLSANCLELSRNLIPLLVVRYISPSISRAMRPFLINIARYSFNCAYERNALYIILVLVAPPFAASKILEVSSVLLLYFIVINLR